jgi:hypothetical protein
VEAAAGPGAGGAPAGAAAQPVAPEPESLDSASLEVPPAVRPIPTAAAESALIAAATARPPGVRESLGGALDLALAASIRVRRASIYVGIVALALAGPVAILFLALIRWAGSVEDAMALFEGGIIDRHATGAITMLGLSGLLALIGLVAITFEGQILATAIVGGVASGRRIGLRRSLRLSRRVFWQVFVAAILVAIVDRVVTFGTAAVLGGATGQSEATTIVEVAAAGLATMPFGFYQAGIILGGVGPVEALRRSVRIARARWRLALLVALAGIVLSFVEVFALGAGLDLVVRFADAAGLGLEGSVPVATLSVLLVLACIVAVGSLVVTIAALVAAPQVFVFLRMTGYSAGLERAMTPVEPVAAAGPLWRLDGTPVEPVVTPEPAAPAPPRSPRLLTWPMVAVIALGFVCALVGLASL